ncbi:hypothetical protein PHMEG_0005496 [Phytophthora megakarya]|uniref:MULE transposase domain-containing protein n=1 Tax=Phytophthora megakarya TaxID=4795 RepID=A0A225WSR2_9STRA|nr:hypothetical protein PHMEG_0005496 [Phytophthora megakarya]
MELPGFKSALVKGLSSARKRVATSVKNTDNINVPEYDKVPSFLRSFARENPGSAVSCQLDTKGRFIRAFMSFGCSHLVGKANGCRYWNVTDGDWGNIPVAVGFVHKETADNFEGFFASCVQAGIKLHDRPLFSDRGKQRDAQVQLRLRGIYLNLKFCTAHMFQHMRSLSLRRFQHCQYQESDNGIINESFPAERTIKVNGKLETQSVAQYLRRIHPTSWTKFRNSKLTSEEVDRPKRLVGGRTTSAVENQNRALLLAGVRDSQVFEALVLFCKVVIHLIADKKQKARNWMASKHGHSTGKCNV